MTPQETAAAFAAEHPQAATLLRAEGSAQERERIQSVRAQRMPGHNALVEALAFDGKTTGPEAAVAVLAAERTKLEKTAAARNSDAPAPVRQAAAEEGAPAAAAPVPASYAGMPVDPQAAQLHARAKAYMAAHAGTGYIDAVKAVQQQPVLVEA